MGRETQKFGVFLGVLVALVASDAVAAGPTGSVHGEALERHRHIAHAPIPRLDRITSGRAGGPVRTVYGYYPYWVSTFDQIRWDLLTHIAYFAVEMNADGSLGARHGWPDAGFVETAHANGVKVDVTFTLFSGSGITTLCSSEANRQRAVTNMIDSMEAGNADGVNVDFEGPDSGTRDCFTTFIRDLRVGLTERGHPQAGIGIAGPAVDWTNTFDLGALAELIDVYFVMGYGYHWTRSGKPGPVGQLRITGAWRPHISISMQRTLDFYTAQLSAQMRTKLVWGVPYYGRDWPTSGAGMHAATTGEGSSRTYAQARRAVERYMRRWDPESENAWYEYSGADGTHQAWYDDEESLSSKYQMVLEQNIGGMGMWALGYDEDFPELWDTLDAYFSEEPVALLGSRALPISIDTFPYADSNDTRLGPSNYFNRYACAPNAAEYGREWVYRFHTCQSGRLEASVRDGTGVDIDLHLLRGADEASCFARDDANISESIGPGVYHLIADSYVSDFVPQEGEYSLTVDFVPDSAGPDCPAGRMCVEGECVLLPVELPGTELITDDALPVGVSAPDVPGPSVIPPEEEGGCGCTATAEAHGGDSFLVGILVLGLVIVRRRGLG